MCDKCAEKVIKVQYQKSSRSDKHHSFQFSLDFGRALGL